MANIAPAKESRYLWSMVVKRYANRRLYDNDTSSYVTLDELAVRVRGGEDITVVDAKTGADLTQPLLAQIILESRGASRLLPVDLLYQLIRMEEEALAEFMGRYMSWALGVYTRMKQGAQAASVVNPLATMPFMATDWLARAFASAAGWGGHQPPPMQRVGVPVVAEPPPEPRSETLVTTSHGDELASLRAELEEIKRALAGSSS